MKGNLRCCVCGRILGVVESNVRFGAVYCPDRPCRAYPPLSMTRAEDRTQGPWIMAVLECTDVSAYALGRALGRASSVADVYKKQAARWQNF